MADKNKVNILLNGWVLCNIFKGYFTTYIQALPLGNSLLKIKGMQLPGSTFFLLLSALVLLLLMGCSSEPDSPFVQLSPSQTNIHFANNLENTPEFNIQNYLYFYDGGGVAAGDINNNGFVDLFFTGNDEPNRLYLNRGDFVFEDITDRAGIINDEGSWSTGVTMADVNGNGYLDIYISRVNYLTKSGANQLFINNGDETFTESAAEYGLDFEGYSTQAAFFDYNNNGRLDMFLLNHSFHSEATYGMAEQLRQRKDPKAGDRLFRNDGDRFTDVTEEAGIISSALGYGLGLAITDINQNGYPDIYVGNDFHEDDYFYINNGDGTFTNQLYSMMGHTSNSSMGNDIADINNNGRPDIISLDMMAEDHEVFLRSGGPDLIPIAEAKENFGFGPKNNRNTLQVNRGISPTGGLPVFSETAFASGLAKTEWSWASLFADFNNNGFVDLYVTNGMPHRPNDLDYVNNIQRVRQQYTGEELQEKQYALIDLMPDEHVPNYMFRNNGDLTFTNVSNEWGFSKPHYSNGAVYADLNNNGKLDLVVNSINEPALVYQNMTPDSLTGNFLRVKLEKEGGNSTGIGSKVFVYASGNRYFREQMPTRGFQSSVDHVLHFGLGESEIIDSLLVIWPDHRYQTIYDLDVNGLTEIAQTDSEARFDYTRLHRGDSQTLLRDITRDLNFNHSHRENNFNDFNREPLMPYKLSTMGPALAVADINGNGLDDIYIGGAHGNAGKLFVQQSNGRFVESEQVQFHSDRASEDVDAIFFDANGNGHPDLYVVSGGNEIAGNELELLDRLYINDGRGNFTRSMEIPNFAVNGSIVIAADYNGNGHLDLFVGGHSIPWQYGVAPQSVLLENDGNGRFSAVTGRVAPGLEVIGNVTSAVWVHRGEGELPDLVVAGEWMPIHYFENRDGQLVQRTEEYGLDHLTGLWQNVTAADLTGNGHMDIIAGNFGINSRIRASQDSPLKMYINDFDDDGQTAPLLSIKYAGKEMPFEQLDELRAQIPNIIRRVNSYREFSQKSLDELFDPQILNESLQKNVRELRSIVLLNNGDGRFTEIALPFEAQWFPVKAIHAQDLDGSGNTDLILAGNIFDVKPSMGGRQDAGFGLVLKGDGTGYFTSMDFSESGLFIEGEARSVKPLQFLNGENGVVVARNNQTPLFFKWNGMEID